MFPLNRAGPRVRIPLLITLVALFLLAGREWRPTNHASIDRRGVARRPAPPVMSRSGPPFLPRVVSMAEIIGPSMKATRRALYHFICQLLFLFSFYFFFFYFIRCMFSSSTGFPARLLALYLQERAAFLFSSYFLERKKKDCGDAHDLSPDGLHRTRSGHRTSFGQCSLFFSFFFFFFFFVFWPFVAGLGLRGCTVPWRASGVP